MVTIFSFDQRPGENREYCFRVGVTSQQCWVVLKKELSRKKKETKQDCWAITCLINRTTISLTYLSQKDDWKGGGQFLPQPPPLDAPLIVWCIFSLLLFSDVWWKSRERQRCLQQTETTNRNTLHPSYTSTLEQSHFNEDRTLWLSRYFYPCRSRYRKSQPSKSIDKCPWLLTNLEVTTIPMLKFVMANKGTKKWKELNQIGQAGTYFRRLMIYSYLKKRFSQSGQIRKGC